MIKLASATKRTAKSGKVYYSASLGGCNVVVFINKDEGLDIMLDERKPSDKATGVPQDRRQGHPYAPKQQSQQSYSNYNNKPNYAPQSASQPAWDPEDPNGL